MFISYFFYSILKFHQISERHTLWPIQKWSIRKLPKDRTSIRAHNSIQGKNRICSRTKLYPLQSIQDVYQAFTQTMEPSNGDMEERQSPRVLATGRMNIYNQAIETCEQLPNNLLAERRGENILCCTRKTYDNIPNSKSVHRHISTEWRCSRVLGLFRTHQRYQPDHPWSKGEQQRPLQLSG